MKLRLITAALTALLALITANCSMVAAVRPLHRGESSVAASIGGPVANIRGTAIPMPYVVARYRYGLSDKLGLYAGGHLLAAGLGLIGFDGGLSYHFLQQKGGIPEIGASAGFAAFIQPGGEQALFPQFELVGSYLLGDRLLPYFGTQGICQFNGSPGVILAPLIGIQGRLNRRFSLTLETKWYAPAEMTHPRNVGYLLPIGGRGAVGFVLGGSYVFGGQHE